MQGLQFRPSGVVLLYFEHRPGLRNAAVGQNGLSKSAYTKTQIYTQKRATFTKNPAFLVHNYTFFPAFFQINSFPADSTAKDFVSLQYSCIRLDATVDDGRGCGESLPSNFVVGGQKTPDSQIPLSKTIDSQTLDS